MLERKGQERAYRASKKEGPRGEREPPCCGESARATSPDAQRCVDARRANSVWTPAALVSGKEESSRGRLDHGRATHATGVRHFCRRVRECGAAIRCPRTAVNAPELADGNACALSRVVDDNDDEDDDDEKSA